MYYQNRALRVNRGGLTVTVERGKMLLRPVNDIMAYLQMPEHKDNAADSAPVMEAIYNAFLTASRRQSATDKDFLAAFAHWSNQRGAPIAFAQRFAERYTALGDEQMAAWMKTMYDHFQAIETAQQVAKPPAAPKKPQRPGLN